MSFSSRRRLNLVVVSLVLLMAPGLVAQVKSVSERLKDAEDRLKDLEARDKKRNKELDEVKAALGQKKKSDDKGFYADGVLTLGGVKLKLGGKAELLFIDSESERDGVVGSTENPDPRFEINRLRLSPTLLFNKEFSLFSQIDFKPEEGRTLLKEMVVRHRLDPEWWLRSDIKFGLDDRFIRPTRNTKNYPLLGNAFWRDESIALTWMVRLGDRDGEPLTPGAGGLGPDSGRDTGVVLEDGAGELLDADQATLPAPGRRGPFDFADNWGEVRSYFSLGNGNSLDANEVGFDGASFNDLVQDNRNVTEDLSIREVGLGLGYARNFEALGDLEVLGFYYNDELSDTSVEFLQQDFTVRNSITGAPTAGYGDSNSTTSYKYGFGGEYFLRASEFVPASWKPRNGDGLRIAGQVIRAHDGRLIRDGWYVQGSYRFSFPERLIAKKYFRSIQPLVRYGILESSLERTPLLPGTWDRRQLLIGGSIEVTREVLVRVEYTFNRESTGAGGASPGPSRVGNDELLVELLLQF